MTNSLVKISNLSVDFAVRDGSFRAVDGVSFDLHKNETLALVGESGSGKSVTAMSILQLLPRPQATFGSSSSIKFDGNEIIDASSADLRKIRGNIISMVFQIGRAHV